MNRLYENRALSKRANLSMGILVVVFLWGFWELYRAFTTAPLDTTSVLFGALFIGGGVYGFWRTMLDNQDLVIAFDADEAARTGTFTLWRPFRTITVDTPLDRLTDWRFWVKVSGRSMRAYEFLVTLAGYPRPLRFELIRGQVLDPGLRRLAPQAVADFETETGTANEAGTTTAPKE